MPWERKTVMEQREEFVEAYKRREKSLSALCREYGISRKSGYKWIRRAEGGEGMEDRSRRPHRCPGRTSEETEQLIVEMRQHNPVWGGKMIRQVLENQGYTHLPCVKTCCNILKRNGCISEQASQEHRPVQRFAREKCNQLWQTDFKGEFALGDGSRCTALDILDDHSRFCLLAEGKRTANGVKESFLRVFEQYGLPDAVLSDNGRQFGGFQGGYSQFERFLMDLDILPIHGRVMHPQTQGKIERFHRTMKQELLSSEPAPDLAQAQRMLEAWRWRYNHIRPHSAIGMVPPAEVYQPSQRKLFVPDAFDYGSGARLLKVDSWGYLRFPAGRVYLSETFQKTWLLVTPTANDDAFQVIYRNFRIALIDHDSLSIVNRSIRKL